MLVFNTTYYVPDALKQSFLHWLRHEYLPQVAATSIMQSPRVLRVMGMNAEEQTSVAVQFEVASLQEMRRWRNEYEEHFNAMLSVEFDGQIQSFSTMLEPIEMQPDEASE